MPCNEALNIKNNKKKPAQSAGKNTLQWRESLNTINKTTGVSSCGAYYSHNLALNNSIKF
jgi:hypothetical protein